MSQMSKWMPKRENDLGQLQMGGTPQKEGNGGNGSPGSCLRSSLAVTDSSQSFSLFPPQMTTLISWDFHWLRWGTRQLYCKGYIHRVKSLSRNLCVWMCGGRLKGVCSGPCQWHMKDTITHKGMGQKSRNQWIQANLRGFVIIGLCVEEYLTIRPMTEGKIFDLIAKHSKPLHGHWNLPDAAHPGGIQRGAFEVRQWSVKANCTRWVCNFQTFPVAWRSKSRNCELDSYK